jgi:hypothetical protein
MYVSMYVCMCVCMYVCMYVCVYVCIYKDSPPIKILPKCGSCIDLLLTRPARVQGRCVERERQGRCGGVGGRRRVKERVGGEGRKREWE